MTDSFWQNLVDESFNKFSAAVLVALLFAGTLGYLLIAEMGEMQEKLSNINESVQEVSAGVERLNNSSERREIDVKEVLSTLRAHRKSTEF